MRLAVRADTSLLLHAFAPLPVGIASPVVVRCSSRSRDPPAPVRPGGLARRARRSRQRARSAHMDALRTFAAVRDGRRFPSCFAPPSAVRRRASAALRRTNRSARGRGCAPCRQLDGQDEGQRHKGRQFSDSGVKARFYQAVCAAKLACPEGRCALGPVTYDTDERALARARMLHGRLILGDERRGSDAPRNRCPLPIAGRHRARLRGAEVGDRHRARVPPAAETHPRARADLLPRTRAVSGIAHDDD
ncbi:hypothetical protein AWB78_08476 [Caballeronia calidae]|uniref:Uncharacterized protein n=1 Tax=Caballeronia calidae TaxID=1777139 RepID=A0A158EJX7_9BURK|nr:hypothetical protein AWB78_08476 [Caballeronia calidae]